MNAGELLDLILARGVARPTQARTGVSRAVVVGGIEVAVAEQPRERNLRARWRERVGGTGTPYLLIADQPGEGGLVVALGPSSPDAPIRLLSAEALAEILERGAQLSSLEAVRHVAGEIDRLDRTGIAGLKLKGLLTIHTLDVRLREDSNRWDAASALVAEVTSSDDWRAVLTQLGYRVERRPHRGWLARHSGRPIAVIHPKADPGGFARLDADGRPPEGILVGDCRSDGAPYGLLVHRGRFRLFDAGAEGSTAEWLDVDAELLHENDRPFLALLSPPYLAEGGLVGLQTEARAFGAGLRKRLDTTIRQDALPALATGVDRWTAQEGIDAGDDAVRLELERASMTLLFRLLFILYAESSGFLPMDNHTYRQVSLSALVDEAARTMDRLSPDSTALWSRFVTLVKAMRSGNPAWEVPAYNGALFADSGFEGAETLERLELADPDFARVLVAVGRDEETDRGVDFSTLEIGHLGHIYEALLSLRLSVADRPLRYDPGSDRYVSADSDADVDTGALLWLTNEGGRKSGGVYYTRAELVQHLVRRAVLPTFERHLDQVRETAMTDPEAAATELLRFAVLDPACGSAHFLVQVVEALANRTVLFLAETPLPDIVKKVEGLRAGAAAGVEIDDVALLRRLILKHCVFGVDISPMGAEVATLSLWLGSFVPGLSLAYLGRNVVVGNSLIGVARPEAIRHALPAPKKGQHGDFYPADLGDAGAFFQDELQAALEAASSAVAELVNIDDRTPGEYEASEAADDAARGATAGLRRLFDLWTAEGFGLVGARQLVELHGIDVIGGHTTPGTEDLVAEAEDLAEAHRFLHWPLEFPRVFAGGEPGFDVVVGNPPWEEVKPERLSFATLHQPGIKSLPEAERDKAIDTLFARRPELDRRFEEELAAATIQLQALAMGGYDTTTGDPDLYKFFCQRYSHLVRHGGGLGVVLPRTAFVNDGSEGFRRWLFETTTARRLDFLLNKGRWAFDSEPRYTVALVVAERATPAEDHVVEVAGTASSLEEWQQQSESDGLRLAAHAFGPGWITPLLRTQAEADLLNKVRVGSPFPLGSNGRWRCFPVAELHESKDKRLWRDATEGRPLWKGESFDQYDPHGAGERLCPLSEEVMRKVNGPGLRPGAKSILAPTVRLAERRAAISTEVDRARVAFRGIGRATDSHTIIACLIPRHTLLVNSAPYLAFLGGDERAQAACLGIMNSVPFDWQARRFIEANVNFFLLEGLVVPDLDDHDFNEIAQAAARLSAVDERYAAFAEAVGVDVGPLDDDERQRLRIEIDACIARSWKLDRDDLTVMFSDFTTDAVSEDHRAALVARLEELT